MRVINYRHSCILILLKQRNRWKHSRQAMPHTVIILFVISPKAPRRNLIPYLRWRINLRHWRRCSLHSSNHSKRTSFTWTWTGDSRDLPRRSIRPWILNNFTTVGWKPWRWRRLRWGWRFWYRRRWLAVVVLDSERFVLGWGMWGGGWVDHRP
jgi:hypothetical protein